ncbi:hypothetical protein WA026_009810 [Henosepilachna vigintioctopunctata]|uniref:Uncharacterized protein n=1 Tax=Henosepilachna vigintioctopunctata TaxID=420089 RepID=A0AAW1TRU2_9CUCU
MRKTKMSSNLFSDSSTSQSSGSLTLPMAPRRPKSMVENLLVAKMEQVAMGAHRQLVRSDSVDSNSSVGSVGSLTSNDVCRCDDCILGIGDLYAQLEICEGSRRKKVTLDVGPDCPSLALPTAVGTYPLNLLWVMFRNIQQYTGQCS